LGGAARNKSKGSNKGQKTMGLRTRLSTVRVMKGLKWLFLAPAWAASIALYSMSPGAALTTPALADSSFPSIDSASYCNALSAFSTSPGSPGSDLLRSSCLKSEATFGDKLRRAWPKINEADRSQCLRLLATTRPSNTTLDGCITIALGGRALDDLAALKAEDGK
jgi:hypothetical protein